MHFKYKAIKNGITVENRLEAATETAAVDYLKKNGYFPIKVEEVKKQENTVLSTLFDKINFNDIVDFTRQIAIMLNAGLTLIDSLEILKKQISKVSMKTMIENVDGQIKSGEPFSSALKKYPGSFPNLYISLVKSGEASGKLGEILLRLADNLEKERELKSRLKGALIYPVIVVCAMILVMFIMITFVIPKLLGLYKDFNVELPWSTQLLITISEFSTRFWPLIIGGVGAGIYMLRRYLKTKIGKETFDGFSLHLPVFGQIIRVSSLVDTTRTLSILIGAGVSILEALNIIIETTGNSVFQKAFINISRKVEKGQSLGAALDQEGIFPPILVQMTQVGEQTGNLDDTLLRLSKYFESESEIAIKSMTTLIEPMILVVLGAGVGFLVLSVITPIYNLTSSFQ